MGHRSAGQERNGVLRLLSLALIFSDEPSARALSDEKLLAAMAHFEGALAQASARAGLIPGAAAETIAQVCERAVLDSAQLARAARRSGALAIPFVKELTAQVAAVSGDAARYVHFGATSQDVLDTAVALCLKPACARLDALAVRLGDAVATLAARHRGTPMTARTLLQPAAPVPFGWKAAVWLSALTRALPHFRAAAADACLLQFGGAVGTLSAFGEGGDAVAGELARALGLRQAPVTWHSTRDGFARLGAEAAIMAGAAAKIARDVSLLMQAEVGEALEPAAGGSSSLPHKRNPAGSLLALEAVQRTPALAATLLAELTPEHERGLGQWQSQWFTLRELLLAAASAVAAMGEALQGLELDTQAMLRNLDRTQGLVFSEAVAVRLARALGKPEADALTARLCESALRQRKSLLEVMRADAAVAGAIPAAELAALFDPQRCFASAGAMIERATEAWQVAR